MNSLAGTRGGRCISTDYINASTPLLWQCSAGHKWKSPPSRVKKGHWCPFCARVAVLTLQELKQFATQRGGLCASLEYTNSLKPLIWKCAVGHEWRARASSIKAGSWCPACAHNKKSEIEEMKELARVRGGKCLSVAYKNGRTPLIWECNKGHRWKACPANVKDRTRKKGSWCLRCYNARRVFRARQTIQTMQALALSRDGRCLSEEYNGSKSKLLWRCASGHEWEAPPVYVVQGTWCPVCARNQRLKLTQLQTIAASRGGHCLSRAYVNERTPLAWSCAAGHRWIATPGKVKRGSWCAKCSHICRRSKWTVQPPS